MKTIGIQIKGAEATIVVLEKDTTGSVIQTKDCCKFKIDDSLSADQVKQFRDQINSFLDSMGATRVGVIARNSSGKSFGAGDGSDRAPSPLSFKLEGIIQLYDHVEVEIVWKQSTIAYYRKNPKTLAAKNKYQNDAFDLAYYLMQ